MRGECLIKTIRLRDYIQDYIHSLVPRPFDDPPSWDTLMGRFAATIIEAIESILSRPIFVESPTYRIPGRFQAIIEDLANENLLNGLTLMKPIGGWPEIEAISSSMGPDIRSSGLALDYETAFTKMLAESLERFSAFTPVYEALSIYSYRKLASRAANPEQFITLSDEQLQNLEAPLFNPDAVIRWAPARILGSGVLTYIPAELCYFRYQRLPGETMFKEENSSGVAAGNSWEMAALNALCEVVERDAAMAHWLHKIPAPRIDVTAIKNPLIQKVLQLYQTFRIDFQVIDLTTDIEIPVVATMIKNTVHGKPVVYIETHADIDQEDAILKSLVDGLRWGYGEASSNDHIERMNRHPEDIRGIPDRKAYWSDPVHVRDADFLIGETTVNVNPSRKFSVEEKLQELKKIFKRHDLEAYLAEITHPVAKKWGLVVLAAVVPKLVPLYLSERFKPLRSKRATSYRNSILNTQPHPIL